MCGTLFAAPISYTYDSLNRLTSVDNGNGQQVITYTYDAAGNLLSRVTAMAEQLPPVLTITSPVNGFVTNVPNITLTGSASDAGQGESGITSVTVNALPADNGTATGGNTANWSLDVGLGVGTNTFTVIATDGSAYSNQVSNTLTVVYLPRIADLDGDGLPDDWETAHNAGDPDGDPDLDGVTTREEYKAGTDPQSDLSHPEGAEGVNYVLFRDHFDDNQYDDRWYLAALDPNTSYTLNEAGTDIQTTVLRPPADCNLLQVESFATVDAAEWVYHAILTLDGFGTTVLGLMQDQNLDNRLELVFDNDADPYLVLRSVEAGVLSEAPVTLPGPYQGSAVDVRIAKAGDEYTVYVNSQHQGTVTNLGLGDLAQRPYLVADSCLTNIGFVDAKIDLIEILLDRDADGRPDTWEDANADGVVDDVESDPLDPDMDNDTVPDGHDNCLFQANAEQRDSNGDGYGNRCDADLNNDGYVTATDYLILRSRLNTADADADLNGDGFVTATDYLILRSQLNQPPGPSGLVMQ